MPIFDPKSQALIENWDQTIEKQIKIRLITTDHAEDNQFINFSEQMANMVPGLVFEYEKGKKNLPGFHLKENITYSALPLKKELEPFLEALSQINDGPAPSGPILKSLDKIDNPIHLKLYIALECPHCPHVVRTLMPLAFNCKNINLHIIDGSLFPETAKKDGVMSAPCLILDDDLKWTGSVAADEIIEMITCRDSSQLSAKTLRTILEQGDAAWIVRQMIEKKRIFKGFIKLMVHETWSVRLGAMVVIEELVETDPALAASLCPILSDLFEGKNIPIQGDILYALGEAGDLKTKKWIKEKLPGLVHKDLIDAAKEALESLALKN